MMSSVMSIIPVLLIQLGIVYSYSTPVNENYCRSVSPNASVVWPLDQCIRILADNGTVLSSWQYVCNNDDYSVQTIYYDNYNCDGDPTSSSTTDNINGDGCDRTVPCNIARVDEYLNSYNSSGVCSQNTNDLHLDVAVVLDACWENEFGQYIKISCSEASGSWGYGLTFANYSDDKCENLEVSNTITEPGCFPWDGSPYFIDVECEFRSPVVEDSCRSVSQNNNIVWPIDVCNTVERLSEPKVDSFKYVCVGNDIRRENYNTSYCEGIPESTTVPMDINGNGCDRSTTCNYAVVDEYLNSYRNDTCTQNMNELRVKASIVLDVCSKNDQDGYFTISCEYDATSSFNNKLTYTMYSDDQCQTEISAEELNNPGCFTFPASPYFVDVDCRFQTKVHETSCRSVSQNMQPVWAIDICSSFGNDTTGEQSSMKYVCDENNDVKLRRWENWGCDGDIYEEEIPQDINGDGCDRDEWCEIISVNEYLQGYSDSACTMDTNELHVDSSVVLDVCWTDYQGVNNKATCEYDSDSEFGYQITLSTYEDDDCTTMIDSHSLSQSGCWETDGSPYFIDARCRIRSPVHETTCRSVSQNSQPPWAIDSCNSMEEAGTKTSWMFTCDGEYLMITNYEDSNCQGNSVTSVPEYINSNGCSRTEECETLTVDEYLMQDYDTTCVINNDEFYMHATIVLNTCWQDYKGKYFKATCDYAPTSTFKYQITLNQYSDENCATQIDTASISERGCWNMDDSPYFLDANCSMPSPVYEDSCKSVSINQNPVWPIDKCIGFEMVENSNSIFSSFMYVCDGDTVKRNTWSTNNECTGDSYTTSIPDDVNGDGCDRTEECAVAIFDEYLNSYTTENGCVKNEDDLHLTGSIVLNVCFVNDEGNWLKIGCYENSDAVFGYTLTYTNYSSVACPDGSEDVIMELSEEGCFEFNGSPYFESVECTGVTAQPSQVPTAMPNQMPTDPPVGDGASGGIGIEINCFVMFLMHLIVYFM